MNEEQTPIEPGAAGAPEGAVAEPSQDDIAELYEATGVKAPVPTGKPKGRPKADAGGAKKNSKQDDGSGAAGKGQAGTDGGDKSEASSASGKDGSDGGAADSKGSKVGSASGKDGQADGKVSESGEDDEGGVQADESRNNGAAAKAGESDDDNGAGGAGEDDRQSDDEAEKGKRPGKSNPEVEKRFQQLTADKRAAEERAAELERQLREKEQAVMQAKIAQEDPEYTIDDFRKVRDEQGNIIDLDPIQAELAWRRWKDGYDQRAEERNAEANRQAALEQAQEQYTEQLMRQSVEAYDSLANLMDEYPELVKSSGKFDQDFAARAMPIINKAIIYQPGTEPGNEEGNPAVIMGLRLDPRDILAAMKDIKEEKRTLPLNGVDDNVETRSNVSVSHSRSSDPTIKAANDLYKELNIDKRL